MLKFVFYQYAELPVCRLNPQAKRESDRVLETAVVTVTPRVHRHGPYAQPIAVLPDDGSPHVKDHD